MLEPEQEELLVLLVEAGRNVPQNKRESFWAMESGNDTVISHPGFARPPIKTYKSNVPFLLTEELLTLSQPRTGKGKFEFEITPKGFKYYEYLKQRITQPLHRVETEVRSYFSTSQFQEKHPKAYKKWLDAEEMLWKSDSEQQLTVIGHLCREAMQEFADSIIRQYQLSESSVDKAKTVIRIRRVLNLKKESLGQTEKPFLDALLPYWGTVSDLIQRQEHGAQKEGKPLVWEDGRRVVFQTAIVMFEIDRALARSQ
ncbi:hypothetical protein H6F76_00925 [Leptolyngbya sp. FACHB-321]|nr:hypothetical protein [Leptolyngbya sp. FACHB-321]